MEDSYCERLRFGRNLTPVALFLCALGHHCCASRVREVHRFSIDVILRSLCEVTTAEGFIGALEGGRG